MLESLEIDHFRGMSHLEIGDFSLVNVFLGTNGAGKTSILEAIALAATPLTPGFINSLGQWRDLAPLSRQNDYALKTLFYDLDISKPIRLSFCIDGQLSHLQIGKTESEGLTSELLTDDSGDPAAASNGTTFDNDANLQAVAVTYTTPQKKAVGQIQLTDTGLEHRFEYSSTTTKIKTTKPETLGCFYIQARRATSAGETSALLTRLFETKSDGPFINVMQKVDPRVKRILPGFKNKQPVVLVDIGLSHLIPMNTLGDGFCRVCLMLTGIVSKGPRMLVVDEIDSGLHHSVMEDFWRSLLKLAQTRRMQIFCTTHSEEMLHKTLDAFEKSPDALRIYRLDRKSDNGVNVETYNYEQFSSADTAGFDVR